MMFFEVRCQSWNLKLLNVFLKVSACQRLNFNFCHVFGRLVPVGGGSSSLLTCLKTVWKVGPRQRCYLKFLSVFFLVFACQRWDFNFCHVFGRLTPVRGRFPEQEGPDGCVCRYLSSCPRNYNSIYWISLFHTVSKLFMCGCVYLVDKCGFKLVSMWFQSDFKVQSKCSFGGECECKKIRNLAWCMAL